MASSKVFRKGGGSDVSFNLTPMIDVTFQLIIFFILTSQIASKALAPVELTKLYKPQTISEDEEIPNKIIVNILYDEKRAAQQSSASINVSVNGELISKKEILGERMKVAYNNSSNKEEFYVELRADKRVPYSDVAPIMDAASQVGIVNMGLTALEDTRRMGS